MPCTTVWYWRRQEAGATNRLLSTASRSNSATSFSSISSADNRLLIDRGHNRAISRSEFEVSTHSWCFDLTDLRLAFSARPGSQQTRTARDRHKHRRDSGHDGCAWRNQSVSVLTKSGGPCDQPNMSVLFVALAMEIAGV